MGKGDIMAIFRGTAAADRIFGGAEADQILGLEGNDRLYGMAGNDVIYGGPGDDVMIGGAGDDTYDVDSGGDVAAELPGEGIDRVRASVSHHLGANIEILILTGSADLAGTGNALANTIVGTAGANLLNGAAGDDVLIGGAGNDVYEVDSTRDRVMEAAGEGDDRVRSSASYALGANIETLILTGTADLNGFGNGMANTIVGTAGANVLNGGAGNDVLIGGAGNDVYDVDSFEDRVQEAVGEGYDRVRASTNFILGPNIEEIDLTGAANIDGQGNSLDNALIGNNGSNELSGRDGNDWIYGGDGDDSLFGGAGFDRLFGGAGNDSLSIQAGDAIVGERYDGGDGEGDRLVLYSWSNIKSIDLSYLVVTGVEEISNAGLETISLTSSQINSFSFNFVGNYPILQITTGGLIHLSGVGGISGTIRLSGSGNEIHLGTVGVTAVEGGNGNDMIFGVSGSNTTNHLSGGSGNDTLIGGGFINTLDGGAGNDHIEVRGGFTNQISGGDGNDALYGGLGLDRIFGGSGNDFIIGDGGGSDELYGGAGDDQIVGGIGTDWLRGDAGSDIFVFILSDNAIDYIYDFNTAQGDKFIFKGLLHGTFAFLGTGAFTGSGNTEVRYSGGLTVDIDGNGTVDIKIGFIVSGGTPDLVLHASDFVFL
jgi:Ca2+-binding RTX toxin-like protein